MLENRKRLIRIILIVAAAIVFLFFITWLINRGRSGTLELKAATGSADVTVTIQRPETKDKKITLKSGETKRVKLPVSNVRVNASAGAISSVDVVPILGAKTSSINVPSGEQRDAKQLASSTQNCPFAVAGRAYAYTCQGNSTIEAYTQNTSYISTATTLFNGQNFTGLVVHGNGLLGFTVDNGTLVYLDVTNQTITPIALQAGLSDIVKKQQPQLIAPDDPTLPTYAMFLAPSNQLFVFKDTADMSPVVIKPPHNAIAANFSDNGNGLILYSGTVTANDDISTDSNETTKANTPAPTTAAYVYQYDLAGTLRNTINMPKNFAAQAVYKLSTNYYLVQQPNTFDFYFWNGSTMTYIYSLPEVASWTTFKNTTYLQSNNNIYAFVPGTKGGFSLHSVYSSPNITVGTLHAATDGVVFSGLTGKDELQRINAYELLSTKQGSAPPQVATAYSGFNELLNNGVSAAQLTDLKIAFTGYFTQANITPRTVEFKALTVLPRDPNSNGNIARFSAVIDGVTYKATIDYDNLTDLRLILSDLSGKQLYDSGVISQTDDQYQ